MDRQKIRQRSRQTVRIGLALRQQRGGWITSSELARAAGVAGRTVRAHLSIWVAFDHVEARVDMHPPHYRIANPKDPYWQGFDELASIFDVTP